MDNPGTESSLTPDQAASELAKLFEAPPQEEAARAEDQTADASGQDQETTEQEVEPEAAASESAEAPVTVEVDGKQITLTKEQVAEAYKGQLRQADYTRKTMEAAETRKAAEAETEKARQERATYAQNLQKFQAQLEGAIEQEKSIDWEALRESNPMEFMRQWHLSQQRQAALQENQRQQQALVAKISGEQAQELRTHLDRQQQELLAKLPEWKDATKADAERNQIKSFLKEAGYTEKEIDGISDHRAVLLARDAMKFREMTAKAQAAAKKVANVPTKVQQPGTSSERSPLDGRNAAMQRHAKSGTVESAAAVFRNLL